MLEYKIILPKRLIKLDNGHAWVYYYMLSNAPDDIDNHARHLNINGRLVSQEIFLILA